MKRLFILALAFFLPCLAQAKLNVVATLPVFASLAEEVGGERVEVTSLARGNQDPHFLDAKPTFVVALSRADLLIEGGLDLEVGWLPAILTQSRNGKIQNGAPGNVNAAQGLKILEVPGTRLDRSMGDVHPLGNPHTWLDPRNAKLIAANIYQHLVKIDPEGKAYYEGRLKDFLGRLDRKIGEWESAAAGFRGKNVLSYHRSFSYFADWTGLNVVDNVESKPGIAPSPKHVEGLLKLIPAEHVKAILGESYYPKKVPIFLSEKTQIPYLVLPTDTDELGVKAYFELIDHLVHEIQAKLQ
ncbi:MAG TPA: zinc ABC transporter substrate-binding protein [Deltaproteobacteria bacterium]|nr:zinc ABC transporter substrate-binding protein [Deltaproteobacteria bacterium]